MCNRVYKCREDTRSDNCREGWEPEFQPIPEVGTGWKVFEIRNQGQWNEGLKALINYNSYMKDVEGWVSWIDSLNRKGEGFCFFPSKKEAMDAAKYWPFIVKVKKIRYEQGLGSFFSPEYDSRRKRFAIAKRFCLANENKKRGEVL